MIVILSVVIAVAARLRTVGSSDWATTSEGSKTSGRIGQGLLQRGVRIERTALEFLLHVGGKLGPPPAMLLHMICFKKERIQAEIDG